MKCPSCGKTWEEEFVSSNIHVCPFCGKPLTGSKGSNKGSGKESSKGNNEDGNEDGIRTVLKKIFDTNGIEILDDNRRIKAFMMDYAPGLERERKVILSALQEGVGKKLAKAADHGEDEIQFCIKKCIRQLVTDIWITENASRYAVQSIAYALGIQVEESAGQCSPQNTVEPELQKGTYTVRDEKITDFLKNYQMIGYKAFSANAYIKEVIMHGSIKVIKAKAFLNCINLRKVVLPGGIEDIGYLAFEGCCSLEEFVLEGGRYYAVINGLLIDKRGRSVLRAQNRLAGKKIRLPEGIGRVDSKAFERLEIEEIYIPKSVREIRKKAFYICGKLEKIEADPKNEVYCSRDGVLHSKNLRKMILYPCGRKNISYIMEDSVEVIEDDAFAGAANLESITFTSSLKVIGKRAFQCCNKMESLVLPGSVEVIGERAFQYCQVLRSVMLSRNIKEIGDYAFSSCSSINTLSVPRSVERIGHFAFAGCKRAEKIMIQDRVSFIGAAVFEGCSKELEVCIKDNDYVERYCKAYGIKYSRL